MVVDIRIGSVYRRGNVHFIAIQEACNKNHIVTLRLVNIHNWIMCATVSGKLLSSGIIAVDACKEVDGIVPVATSLQDYYLADNTSQRDKP